MFISRFIFYLITWTERLEAAAYFHLKAPSMFHQTVAANFFWIVIVNSLDDMPLSKSIGSITQFSLTMLRAESKCIYAVREMCQVLEEVRTVSAKPTCHSIQVPTIYLGKLLPSHEGKALPGGAELGTMSSQVWELFSKFLRVQVLTAHAIFGMKPPFILNWIFLKYSASNGFTTLLNTAFSSLFVYLKVWRSKIWCFQRVRGCAWAYVLLFATRAAVHEPLSEWYVKRSRNMHPHDDQIPQTHIFTKSWWSERRCFHDFKRKIYINNWIIDVDFALTKFKMVSFKYAEDIES